jgi:hypothetical protein
LVSWTCWRLEFVLLSLHWIVHICHIQIVTFSYLSAVFWNHLCSNWCINIETAQSSLKSQTHFAIFQVLVNWTVNLRKYLNLVGFEYVCSLMNACIQIIYYLHECSDEKSFFFQICDVAQVARSSKVIFSQILRYSKYESRKILSTLSCCRQLWQFLVIFSTKFFFPLKTENLWQYKFFSKYFHKMAKVHHNFLWKFLNFQIRHKINWVSK